MSQKNLFEKRKYVATYLRDHGRKATVKRIIKTFLGLNLPAVKPIWTGTENEILHFVDTQVLIVSGDPSSPSHSYRVDNFVSSFNEIGKKSLWVSMDTFKTWNYLPSSVELVIFWRTNIPARTVPVLRNNLNAPRFLTAYDTDDLIFDKSVYTPKNVPALNQLTKEHRDYLVDELTDLVSEQISDSNFGIAPTKRIAKSFELMGKKAFDFPIVIPRWMELQASKILIAGRRNLNSSTFRIIYASGTNSHQIDFENAWGGLKAFLTKHELTELHILGHNPLTLKEIPLHLRSRVITHEFVKHNDLLSFLSEFDLQISPLELGNDFVEAKSATKFMQGAAVKVPTIASPTHSFNEVISHGINGWLASTDQEWLSSLESAFDIENCLKVSEAAHNSYLKFHTVSALIPKAKVIAEQISVSFENSRVDLNDKTLKKKITWILPNLPAGSGGHRNVLRFAHYLPNSLYESNVLVMNTELTKSELSEFVRDNYGLTNFSVTTDVGVLSDSNIVFATHHETVDLLRLYAPRNATKCYLVQDFESLFNPMSDKYLHALETYFDKSLNIICSGEWMSQKIKQITNRTVPFFQFPIDTSIYNWNQENEVERKGVLFFAKADSYRRLADLGLNGLSIVRKLMPDVPIGIFGTDPNLEVPGVINHGRIPTLEGLAALYRQYAVGVAFSTTNPSLIPYEMMACGLPVVDVIVRDDKFPKFGVNPAAKLVSPDAVTLSDEIVKLLSNHKEQEALRLRGVALAKSMPSETQIAEIMQHFLDSL